MTTGQQYIANPEYRAERFENEILLYSVSNTTGLYLNETAYLVWEMCCDKRSIEEIVSILEDTYHLQKEQIREDVFNTVKSLVENSAIIPCHD